MKSYVLRMTEIMFIHEKHENFMINLVLNAQQFSRHICVKCQWSY